MGWAVMSRVREEPSCSTSTWSVFAGSSASTQSASRSTASLSRPPSAADSPKSPAHEAGVPAGIGRPSSCRAAALYIDTWALSTMTTPSLIESKTVSSIRRWVSDSTPLRSSSAISAARCSRIRASRRKNAAHAITSRSMIEDAGKAPSYPNWFWGR